MKHPPAHKRVTGANATGFSPRKSLRFRIVRESMLVAALAIAVISLLSILVARTLLADRMLEQISAMASARKDILESNLQYDRERSAFLADRPEVRALMQTAGQSDAARILEQQRANGIPLLGISVFDTHQHLLTSVGLTSAVPSVVGATTLVPFVDDIGTWRGYDVYASIHDNAHNDIGTLALRYDATPLLTHVFGTMGIDDGTEIVLGRIVMGDVSLLHHSLEKDNLHSFSLGAPNQKSAEATLLNRAIAGNEGQQKIINSAGTSVLTAYRFIPSLGWGMVVAIDRETALVGVSTFATQLFVISILLMICAGIIGFFLATSLTAPLLRVSSRLHLLKPGHWSFGRSVHTGDEVEVLDRVIADLTSRLKKTYDHLEELVAERTADLEKESALDRAILDSIESGVLTIDTQGIITDTNPAALKLLGFSAEEFHGKAATDMLHISQRHVEEAPATHPVTVALANQKSYHSNSFMHLSLLKKDQTLLPVVLTVTPLLMDQKLLGAIVMFQDMTEDRQIDYMKSEFITLASHQLRTPLSAVRWNLELMGEENGALSEEQKAFIKEISASSARMASVLDGLLRAARLEEGNYAAGEAQQIDVNAFLTRIVHDNESMAQAATIRLTMSLPEQPTPLSTDPVLLEVVLQNLVANAVKYSNAGSEIHVSLAVNPTGLAITVEDHGMGIPASEQKRIFERFFRAHNIRQKDTDGTGLGLYIAKRTIESLGGTISFVSTEGKGTVFTVTLPLTSDQKTMASPSTDPGQGGQK